MSVYGMCGVGGGQGCGRLFKSIYDYVEIENELWKCMADGGA